MGSQRLCWEFEGARYPAVGQAGWRLAAQIFIWDLTCTQLVLGEGRRTTREGDGRRHSEQQWMENSLQKEKEQGARRVLTLRPRESMEEEGDVLGRTRARGRAPHGTSGRVPRATCSGLWEAVEVQPDYGG